MSDSTVSEAIRQFFGGYFHEDWALEAEDWQTSVDNFTVGETSTKLLALAEEIDDLCAARSEDELGVVMYQDALSSYYPGPLTYHEWLMQVADRLRQHASAIERGGTSKQ